MFKASEPRLKLLDQKFIIKIVEEAKKVLENIGVYVENKEAVDLLLENDVKYDKNKGRFYFDSDLINRCLQSVPKEIKLYDRNGDEFQIIGGDNVCFDPGSAALDILDYEKNVIRKPVTKDYKKYAVLVDKLDNIKAQSTAFICSDVPKEISDSYRLFLSLAFGKKPIITGTFFKESFESMKEMLLVIRGSKKALAKKPLAIFDACPSPPLKWSDLTCQSLLDAAKFGIPSEFVSMPLTGATSPATISGALVQHTAENLSGVVITQLAKEGTPIIYGGSPALFDMKYGTTPMGAIETMMIDSAYSQIGKYLGIPTHAYMGLSDSKYLDYQAGFESGIGLVLAALSGINMVSGAGMMNFESLHSMEKLVIDNEICGIAYRLVKGIEQREETMAFYTLRDCIETGEFITHPSTLKWFRDETYFVSDVIDRSAQFHMDVASKNDSFIRANKKVHELLDGGPENFIEKDKFSELEKILKKAGEKLNFSDFPELEI